ncbi:MAG: cobalt ECF transporter T component CbiQ, partial [Chloroflexi bacterium]|nr:cobalt ECF transporter T component CbiQ [Chloroflexota bacterium]
MRAGLDRYVLGTSPLHRADPRVKVVVALAGILAISLLPPGAFAALAVALMSVALLGMAAGVGPLRAARGGFIALPFTLAAVPLVFTRAGQPLATLDVGPLTLAPTGEGAVAFATILL